MKRPQVVYSALFIAGLIFGLAAPVDVWGQVDERVRHYEPGSVLVFPKFQRGTVTELDGSVRPRSSFGISVTCPPFIDAALAALFCFDPVTGLSKTVHLRAKWVCPPLDPPVIGQERLCRATDFLLKTTVNGTLWINPENILNVPASPADDPPPPNCPEGFLIVWVVDGPITQLPISFNGLVGDAILRPSPVTHVTAYNAVSFQAIAVTGTITSLDPNRLFFNGTTYTQPVEKFYGSVRYEDANTRTFLTLLTMEINANTTFNDVHQVEFKFFNENEDEMSAGTSFVCWREVQLTTISPGLTTMSMQGVKGLVSADNNFTGDGLLGLIRTEELIPDPLNRGFVRGYAYSVYNDGSDPASDTFQQFID